MPTVGRSYKEHSTWSKIISKGPVAIGIYHNLGAEQISAIDFQPPQMKYSH